MLFDNFQQYRSSALRFTFAEQSWELKSYYDLRRSVFCDEQRIFDGTDRDAIDAVALPIICNSECMGMPDQVIGAVRIHETAPGEWLGSRLAVHADFRKFRSYNALQLFNDAHVVSPFTMSIGASLIFKAVSSANSMGCNRFLAFVQYQNVNFFERLHWKSIEEVQLHGYLHHRMEADLNYYPASVHVNHLVKHVA